MDGRVARRTKKTKSAAQKPPGGRGTARREPALRSGYSLVGELAIDLGRRIVAREFAPGVTLPTEPEIQKSYRVSRTVVREATRLLAAKGLISVRPKTGVRTRPPDEWNMLDSDVMRWHLDGAPDTEFIMALYEVREIFEPQAARLAAERISPDGREKLALAMREMESRPSGSAALIDADLEFHRVILAAAGNPVLRSFGALIEQTMAISFALSWRQTTPGESLEQHRMVCDAVLEGNAVDAAYAMRCLVRAARSDVLAAMTRDREDQGKSAVAGQGRTTRTAGSP
jgi:DNA-binding FadR family transcriptional regulator